jgi:TolA-binding protein
MRKTFYYVLFCLVIFNGLLFANPAIDPNKAVSIAVQPQSQNLSTVSVQQQSIDYQQKLVEEKLDSFNKRADDQKWVINVVLTCMGFVITLMAAFIALIAIKSGREYKEAVDKAEKSADKAQQWEREAQKKCETIEERVNTEIVKFSKIAEEKLQKLEDKSKEYLNELFEEAQKEREFSGKFNEAVRAIKDKDYNLACQLSKTIVKEYPKKWAGFYVLGSAYAKSGEGADVSRAEDYFRQACENYQKATELKTDYPPTFYYWGKSILNLAKLKEGDEKENLYQEAEEVLLKAEEIKRGEGAYSLARLFALRGNEEKCKQWLKIGEEAKTLETREHAMKDEDLASVREKDWFKAIRWKGEQ